jgi:hypothetical protein
MFLLLLHLQTLLAQSDSIHLNVYLWAAEKKCQYVDENEKN